MRNFRSLLASGIIAAGLTSSAATAQTFSLNPPAVPAGLAVPQGNTLFLKGSAVGTQNYICKPSGSGFAWTLFGPQATLFVTLPWIGGDIRQQIMTHFLSANPVEGGTPRATWQSSLDTSVVWARAIANSNDPAFVAPGAIPWLLLEVVGSQHGPAGGGSLVPTTYIQRVNTSEGIAPAAGCTQATVGNTVLVPYTTDYYFYKASRN